METRKYEKSNAVIGSTGHRYYASKNPTAHKVAAEDISFLPCVTASHLMHISSLKVLSLSIPTFLGRKAIGRESTRLCLTKREIKTRPPRMQTVNQFAKLEGQASIYSQDGVTYTGLSVSP